LSEKDLSPASASSARPLSVPQLKTLRLFVSDDKKRWLAVFAHNLCSVHFDVRTRRGKIVAIKFTMNKKRKYMGQSAQQTIIAQGVRVEGDFNSQGSVLIEGEVAGSVKTAEHLQVGESAKIHAHVAAADAVVAGEIKGNVKIAGRLELTETSKVRGDIRAQVLTVAAGAEINGKVNMGEERKGGRKKVVKKDEETTEEKSE